MLTVTITGKGILPIEEATKALQMGLIRVRNNIRPLGRSSHMVALVSDKLLEARNWQPNAQPSGRASRQVHLVRSPTPSWEEGRRLEPTTAPIVSRRELTLRMRSGCYRRPGLAAAAKLDGVHFEGGLAYYLTDLIPDPHHHFQGCTVRQFLVRQVGQSALGLLHRGPDAGTFDALRASDPVLSIEGVEVEARHDRCNTEHCSGFHAPL